jgi:hypothetical protein
MCDPTSALLNVFAEKENPSSKGSFDGATGRYKNTRMSIFDSY